VREPSDMAHFVNSTAALVSIGTIGTILWIAAISLRLAALR